MVVRRRAFLAGSVAAGLGSTPAMAQSRPTIRVARIQGVNFLPMQVMQRLKLVEKHAARLGIPDGVAEWFDFSGGVIAGAIEMIPAADHLLVENVAVSPGHQRQGIGRRLLAYAEQVASELGCPEIRLYTNPLFDGNVRLYQSVGYAIDREEPFMDGTTIYMSKWLGTDPR